MNDSLLAENQRLSTVVGELQEARLTSAQHAASIAEMAEAKVSLYKFYLYRVCNVRLQIKFRKF